MFWYWLEDLYWACPFLIPEGPTAELLLWLFPWPELKRWDFTEFTDEKP